MRVLQRNAINGSFEHHGKNCHGRLRRRTCLSIASPTLTVTAASGDVRSSGDRVVIKTIASGVEGKPLANACLTSRGEITSSFGVEKMRPILCRLDFTE
jgi:hypothetical protein